MRVLLILFSIPIISLPVKAQNHFNDMVYPIILTDSNMLDQFDELHNLGKYHIDKKDTAGLLDLYRLEKAHCKSGKLPRDEYRVCIANMIANYLDYVSKEELLNYISLYAKDTSVIFNDYTYGALASIYIRENKIDSAAHYLKMIRTSEDCGSDSKNKNTLKAINELMYFCNKFKDRKNALECFINNIDKFSNGVCSDYFYLYPETRPYFTRDGAIIAAALFLGSYAQIPSLIPKDGYMHTNSKLIYNHFEALLDSGKLDTVLKYNYIIPVPSDRMDILSITLFRDLTKPQQISILDSLVYIAKEDKHNIPFDNGFYYTVEKLLEFNRVEDALLFISLLKERYVNTTRHYCAIASYYLKHAQKKKAEKYVNYAYKKAKSNHVSYLEYVAVLYRQIGNEKMRNKILHMAEKRIPSKAKGYRYESAVEDVAILYSKAGEYEKASEKAMLLNNKGPGSPRSSYEAQIYQNAFENGDTAIGMRLLEKAVQHLPDIEHLHQKHWFIREAAGQYALLKKYDKAFEVAQLMYTNTFDAMCEVINDICDAYELNTTHEMPLTYLDKFLQSLDRRPIDQRNKVGMCLTDQFYKQTSPENVREFESKLIHYVCPASDINYDQLKFQLYLFGKTKNIEAYKKALAMGNEKALAIEKILDRVNALIELQKLQDEINFVGE